MPCALILICSFFTTVKVKFLEHGFLRRRYTCRGHGPVQKSNHGPIVDIVSDLMLLLILLWRIPPKGEPYTV